ncbi:hypothetical protein H7J07_12695 [Mycobacterium koreense]|uniref:Uncharacterized protein n=1 Tax=Mycolicibacillus koreensis TaxID=1069220 RepID=A0A7I7SCT3_9MYCO|nr:hypothetical protein [Mycolicibacillus koreensis]MCV7249074.1 hypothetical protein [Mycolicibacillus koreensis]OSC34125.1 hypothetical protein B8W67_08190 [Mycolicibacillus koreensis]BBY54588.1 hypothetical protein MKOR_18390 [Mycolicibacillus koreensis]
MTVHPQDIEQVRQLATQLRIRAAALEENVTQVTTAIRAVNWTGEEAAKFKSDWFDTHLPNAEAVIATMRDGSEKAAADAADAAKRVPSR